MCPKTVITVKFQSNMRSGFFLHSGVTQFLYTEREPRKGKSTKILFKKIFTCKGERVTFPQQFFFHYENVSP